MSRLLAAALPRNFDLDLGGLLSDLGQFFAVLCEEHPESAQALDMNRRMRREASHWLM